MNRKQGSMRMVLLGVLAVVVLLIAIMALTKPNGKKLPESTETAQPVTVLAAHLTNTVDVVHLPAWVVANVDAILAAEKAGRIVAIQADLGDPVEQGQLLMQIDDRIWQANLRQASIAARDAEKNFERFKKLEESGAVAESEYDRIEKTHIQATSQLEEATINIEQCRVESPITGIVNDRFVEVGEYVQPGTPVFQVVDHATVKMAIAVPEKDIFSVHKGDRIGFTIQPLEGRRFEGVVSFVAAQADARNNSFRTELVVDNTDGTLRPGMIAQVAFHRGTNENMVSLPMSAVLPSKGDHIVYLAKDGQAVRRKVQIETITRERALISQGLEEGDLVIIEGNRALNDGQRVEAIQPGLAE